MTAELRWIRRDRRIYDHPCCSLCGVAWGAYHSRKCPVATCMACGSPQCFSNGLGRGQCPICLFGLLPGWSGTNRPCGYAHCPNRAVAAAPRVHYCCREHMGRAGLVPKLEERLRSRARSWVLVDDSGREVAEVPSALS